MLPSLGKCCRGWTKLEATWLLHSDKVTGVLTSMSDELKTDKHVTLVPIIFLASKLENVVSKLQRTSTYRLRTTSSCRKDNPLG